jgi:hypothetical protein
MFKGRRFYDAISNAEHEREEGEYNVPLYAAPQELSDEVEHWKRKYIDMHNLATQAMSRVHELEKKASEK